MKKKAQSKEKGSIKKTKSPLPKKTAPKTKFSRVSHKPLPSAMEDSQ